MLAFSISVYGQQKDYNLYFKSGAVTPEANVGASRSLPEITTDNLWANNYYCILQFSELPNEKVKSLMQAKGILLQDYLPEKAFLVSMPANTSMDDLVQFGVRAIVHYGAGFKIDPLLTNINTVPESAWDEAGNVKLTVIYHENIPVSAIQSDIKAKYVSGLKNIKTKYQTFELSIPFDKIADLASRPYIKYVECAPGEYVVNDYKNGALHGLGPIHSTSGYNLKGEGVTIGMSDISSPSENIDFKGRILKDWYGNLAAPSDNHGDHTAGTVASGGNMDERYVGQAPKCDLMLFPNIGITDSIEAYPVW